LIPVCALNGFRTSWNAFSSWPPQAVQTMRSPPIWPAADAEGADAAGEAAVDAWLGAGDGLGAGVVVALDEHAPTRSAAVKASAMVRDRRIENMATDLPPLIRGRFRCTGPTGKPRTP
jgi:hypothetical protein